MRDWRLRVAGSAPGVEARRSGRSQEVTAPVGSPLEPGVGDGWTGDITTEALEARPVAGRDADGGVEAHLGVASNRLRVGLAVFAAWGRGFHSIAESAPGLAGIGAGGDARAQRRLGEKRKQGLIAGHGVVVAIGAVRDQAMQSPDRPGEHERNVVGRRWFERGEPGRPAIARLVEVGAV